MEKTIMIVLIDKRKNVAPKVQQILTTWGCIIKTRIGLHDGVLDKCSNSGLIVLELVGEAEKKDKLNELLATLPGVSTEKVQLSLKD